MDLITYTAETKQVTIPFGDRALHVVYKPHAITLKETVATDLTVDQACEQLTRVIASWDLVSGTEAVDPHAVAVLMALPGDLVLTVQQAIVADMRVPEASGAPSSFS
jgi:hypothetical protein